MAADRQPDQVAATGRYAVETTVYATVTVHNPVCFFEDVLDYAERLEAESNG